MALRPVVTEIPLPEAWAVVQRALAGDLGTDKIGTFQVVDDCFSYAVGKVLAGGVSPRPMTAQAEAEAKTAIDSLARGGMGADAQAFPWLEIVGLIISVFAKLFTK